MNTKATVLEYLEQKKGEPVSGGMMARELGVSRNAVWKAINTLRGEGYDISGGSGIGYTLSSDSDLLSVAGIRQHLKEETELLVFDTIDSTNNEAKRIAIDNPKVPLLIVAGEQTRGRGRLGRTFYSPAGSGLYMSFLLKPDMDISKASFMTIAASVAVTKAIEQVTGINCGIKWVNDIYLGDKKVCGILTEAISGMESGNLDYIIVGIGINCHPQNFPPEAGSNPGFIASEINRNKLAAQVADQFLGPVKEGVVSNPEIKSEILNFYRERCVVLGKNIRIYNYHSGNSQNSSDNSGIPALATGIDDDGGLIVKYRDGTTGTLSSGEITIRKD